MGSHTYTSPGWHAFDVPAKVERIEVDLRGGGGGGGRQAGQVHGVLLVKPSWTLHVFVAGGGTPSVGSSGGAGGAGGGADGGNGHSGRNGGDGGGGATYIRINTHDGTIKAVAGGGAGNSGDGGDGGRGGADVGEHGQPGGAGPGAVGNATGGTQTQGGNGGTSSSGTQYNGHNAEAGRLGAAGRGSAATTWDSHGGGGGGGGFHAGGGGQGSAPGFTSGGGGGGGSNYDGGLTQVTINSQGGGGAGDGQVTLEWVDPTPANQPPSAPANVELDGEATSDGMHTRITGNPTVTAKLDDPDSGDRLRMIMHYSTNKNFSPQTTVTSDVVDNHKQASVRMGNLAQNTHYFVRLITIDNHGLRSTDSTSPPGWAAFDFWTNETSIPDHMTVNGGGSGVTISSILSATFAWQFNDPDKADLQSAFSLRYRTTGTSADPPGPWVTITKNVADNTSPGAGPPSHSRNQWVFDPGTFNGNLGYTWQVRTKDLQGLWSDWSLTASFFSTSTTSPPIPKSPINNIAVDVDGDVTFTWQFRDPDGDPQQKADIRWRVVGGADDTWVTTLGLVDPDVPGSTKTWTFHDGTFAPGLNYEWQVRTYDAAAHQSDWSASAFFWSIATPGTAGGPLPVPDEFTPQDVLGCGTYRVFVVQQGGQVVIGEVTPIEALTFNRARDDISAAQVIVNGLGDPDCCEFLSRLRCWMHEIVIYRDGVRVWEGPITLLTFETEQVTINAQDVMVYAFRRIMRQGYNDAFRIVSRDSAGQPVETAGLMNVVLRAETILLNAFAPFDPNILPYLTVITGVLDANESQVREDWSSSAWEEVDKLAADNGLDYTVVGRRIILWGTHTPIGRLPQMTDGDFSAPPIVSEYGMQLATFYAVTNGQGVAGTAEIENPSRPDGTPGFYPYGPVELIVSSFSESDSADDVTLTPDARATLVKALQEQARTGIADRWPTPLLVRVPDNSTLSPDCGFGFQQLVPGVWFPLAASTTCRTVTQWQKLDSVGVTYDNNGEKIAVVMSPAPNSGADPDATGGPITGGGGSGTEGA